MELIDLTKVLKAGDTVYSILHGQDLLIKEIVTDSILPIRTISGANFSKYGRWFESFKDGECVIFPSKDNRDWSKYVEKQRIDQLKEEALKRYPEGTKIRCLLRDVTKVVESPSINGNIYTQYIDGRIWISCGSILNGLVYSDGKWAEIIEEYPSEPDCPFNEEQKSWILKQIKDQIKVQND